MLDRRLVAGGAAVALFAVAMVAFVLLSPRWAVSAFDQQATQQLGRSFSAKGGAHLDFSPLAIRIDGATLSGNEKSDESLLSAKSLVIPVSFGQLLSRKPSLASVTLEEPEIAFLIDERGQASWDLPGFSLTAPMQITLEQASFRYFDARNAQGMTLSNVDGLLTVTAEGGASFTGSAVINSRVVRIDADLKSITRINQDGSPLELVLTADAASANFSGRLSTANVLSLAGPVSISSNDAAEALRLVGLPAPDGFSVPGPLNADGALDTAGRAFAIRNAAITLGAFRAAGDVAADLRGERPKLQAHLAAEKLWLDPFVPASGKQPGEWGRAPIPFGILKGFDADIGIDAQALSYGGFTAAASRVAVTLKDGKLNASGGLRLQNNGSFTFLAKADSVVLPPSLSLSLKGENAEAQPLFGALAGVNWLTGTGSFATDVSAQGQTQEEMAGTLKGTASIQLADGRIAGSDLGGLLNLVRQKIIDSWTAAPGGTPFTKLSADAVIGDGVASFRRLSLETPKVTYTATGVADVLRQALDLTVSPVAGGQPVLPVAVLVKSLWYAPRIYPDVPDILNNPEGGFARLKDVTPVEGN